MALRKRASRIWETSTTTGTGALTLLGAVTGYRAVSAACADTNTIKLTVVNQTTPTEWEQGIYTWNTGATLTRTTVLNGSNGQSAVNFGAGTKDVFSDPQPIDPDLLLNAQTGSYTVDGTDAGKMVRATGSTAQTLTLTAPATLGDGFWCYVEHAGTGTTGANKKLTITPASGTIDGLASLVVYPGDTRLVQCDGANFITVLINGGFINVLVADSPFTFTVPTGWTSMRVDAWGAGGSGGGGEGRAVSIIRSGGGGGGGGKRSSRFFNPGDVGASVTVTVGAGGTLSAGGTTLKGTSGKVGNNTTFGTLITAYGGGGGGAGGDTAATGGGGGGGAGATGVGLSSVTSGGGNGGPAFVSGAAGLSGIETGGGGGGAAVIGSGSWGGGGGAGGGGTANAGFDGGGSGLSAAGGGGAGGITAANPGVSAVSGAGGNTGQGTVTGSGGGGTAGGINGGAAAGTATQADSILGGQGGGGGGANNAGTGGAGATGTVPGGGGGGGGGGTNIGGASGAGGAGAVRIWYNP